jgi:hypothetical protein
LFENSFNYRGTSLVIKVYCRKFSSTRLIAFLSSVIDVLPESSELQETFQYYLNEVKRLVEESTLDTISNVSQKPSGKHTLISQFDIESRPGMRSTKVSQKLRQERDRANMTSEDAEYTKLVGEINDVLKELFGYSLNRPSHSIGNSFHRIMFRFTKPSTLILLKLTLMYIPILKD